MNLSSKSELWLQKSKQELIQTCQKTHSKPNLDLCMHLITSLEPVLRKTGNVYISEIDDVEVALLIGIMENDSLVVSIIENKDNKLMARESEIAMDNEGKELIQAFMLDFPMHWFL